MTYTFRARRLLLALGVVGLAIVALPALASASSGPGITALPAQSFSTHQQHPCADGSGRVCTVEVTVTNSAHSQFAGANPAITAIAIKTASACSTTYGYPTYTVTDHNYNGDPVTQVVLSGEDWWDGCSSGWVWVSLGCTAWPGYSCGLGTHGSFWDSGLGASTAWGNQPTSNFCCTVTWYLRMDIYPSGTLNSRYYN